jgi:hypothetical protein
VLDRQVAGRLLRYPHHVVVVDADYRIAQFAGIARTARSESICQRPYAVQHSNACPAVSRGEIDAQRAQHLGSVAGRPTPFQATRRAAAS